MGLFRKKKKQQEENDFSEFKWMTVDEALRVSRGEAPVDGNRIADMAKELADQLNSAQRIYADAKMEYSAVAKHLCDIERLETMNEKTRARINDTARTIYNLENSRTDYQQGARTVTGEKYNACELYHKDIPEQLRVMEERENYLMLVKNDMRQLEGEKGSIAFEKQCAENKKKFLLRFSYVCIGIVIILFIVLFGLHEKIRLDIKLPMLITGALVAGYAAYYMVTTTACTKTSKKCDVLLNRAIELLNKTKIKYVNTANALDYTYEKYKCNSHQELQYTWNNYVKEKEAEARYRKNTQLLAGYQDDLVSQLKNAGFEIPEIWVHQSELLLDREGLREMATALKERHRKLKAQLSFSQKQLSGINSDVEILCSKYPAEEALVKRVISEES